MEPMSECTDDAPTRTRSLRARQSSVNYQEMADDDYENHSVKSYSKDKKRGSKRKAEINIESLYCQENVKEVNPSSLETIFESPKKEQSRKIKKNLDSVPTEGQLMSLKKLRRFCSFSDYYNPPKQKIKARKDRAKKHKQLTGVKVPKGAVSNEALITALSVLSEEEDQNENMPSGSHKEALSDCNQVKIVNDDSFSFYDGNVIRPDTEDATMNEVVKNISLMQMENDFQDKKDLLSQALCKDLENSLLFSNENENPNLQIVQTHQKKSRRRSQKFSGSLLPPLYANCIDEESLELKSIEANISEDSAIGNQNSLTLAEENANINEIMNSVSNTPKRRNILSDQKEVKKTKWLESSLKRESEYVDQKCLKKRGNLKGKTGQFYDDGHSTNDGNCTEDLSVNAVHSELSVYKNSELKKKVLVSPCSDLKTSVTVKGKKRGKRRVSGIKRPIYRLPLEPNVLDKDLNDSDSSSSHLDMQALAAQSEGSPAILASLQQNISPKILSSTSPCSQMAALSLQSPDTVQQNKSRTRRQSERIRRNSIKLGIGSQNSSVTSVAPRSSASSECLVVENELDRSNPKAQKIKGRRLSSMFSQLELRTEIKDQSICQSVSCETVKKKSLHRDLYAGYSSIDPIASAELTSCERVQTVDPVNDEHKVNQPFSSEGACSSRVCNEQVFSKLIFDTEIDANNLLEFQKPSCDDAKQTAEQGNESLNEIHMNVAEKSESHIKFNPAFQMLEDLEHSSPVLTGMFENKIGIRLGKVYHNQETLVSNMRHSNLFNYPHN